MGELEILIQAERIYSKNMGMDFSIEKYPAIIMKSRKGQMTEGVELPNQEKTIILGEKIVRRNVGGGHHKTGEDREKNNNKYPRRTRKLLEIKQYSKTYHPRDKHLGCPLSKILETIIKVDQQMYLRTKPHDTA